MTMSWRMLWRISSAVFLFVAVLGFTALTPVAASLGGQYEQGQNSLVGTWSFASSDNGGGKNFSWYTFTSNGQYQMVSAIQGGRNNGNVIQRWGRYQARTVGLNSYQVAVQITGGAPTRICAPGQGCTPVQGIQRPINPQMNPNPPAT